MSKIDLYKCECLEVMDKLILHKDDRVYCNLLCEYGTVISEFDVEVKVMFDSGVCRDYTRYGQVWSIDKCSILEKVKK
jgi:hypothetical protein